MMQRAMTRISPAVARSKLALELAAELVGMDGWPHLRAQILMKTQDFDPSGFSIYGSGQPDGIEQVARGEAQLAMINPSAVLTMAYRGTGPFEQALLLTNMCGARSMFCLLPHDGILSAFEL